MDPKLTLNQGIQMAEQIKSLLVEYTVKYGFQVLAGLVILFIGFKIGSWVAGLFVKFCQKRHFDVTLTKFLASVIKIIVMVFTGLMAAEKFGITISPLIASISALIFGASFAIQAPLSNYAAGLTVIITRPFTIGNTITIQGMHGIVEEVKLACTILSTEDGEKIMIPNKDVVGHILVNSFENKVVEAKIGISYSDDPAKAVRVIEEALKSIPEVVSKPGPHAGIQGFGDSAIQIGYRYWIPTAQYWKIIFRANAAIFDALKKANITIPYPRQDVFQITP